jgi:hypothetical protein
MDVRDVRQRVDFELEVVNIMSDPALAVEYAVDIPVVAINEVKYCEHTLDPVQFEKRLIELRELGTE